MQLKEYAFIDTARLNSYYEQIKDGVANAKKIPTWTFGISLTGPSAERSQQAIQHKASPHEMIDTVIEYLKKTDQLVPARHGDFNKNFSLDSYFATKVTIPVKSNSEGLSRKYLNIWISDKLPTMNKQEEVVRFFLIEDSKDSDQSYSDYVDGASGLGALRALLQFEFSRRPIYDLLNISPTEEDKFSKWRFENGHYLIQEFEKNPIGILKERGAIISEPRKITSLFRRRFSTYGFESNERREKNTVYIEMSYPIFISIDE